MKKTLLNVTAKAIFEARSAGIETSMDIELPPNPTEETKSKAFAERRKEIDEDIESELRVSYALASKFIRFAESKDEDQLTESGKDGQPELTDEGSSLHS